MEQLPSWASFVGNALRVRISSEDVLLALIVETGKELQDLASTAWTEETIFDTIKNSAYVSHLPIIEDDVHLDESIIPSDTLRSLYEEQVKFKGEIWVIHKNDIDPFPSSPHAHNYESALKLHLGNGELYYGTDLVGKVARKNFLKLRGLFKRVQLPELEI